MMSATMVAVLGAGAGLRMGGGKLDRDLGGRPLGAWAMASAQSLGAPVCLISAQQQPDWLGPGVTLVHNPDASSGMASSLHRAVEQARERRAGRLLVMLADMPFVDTATLHMLLDRTSRETVTACRYHDGRLGPPACFGGDRLDGLADLAGDMGARQLLNQPGFALGLAVDAEQLMDIDTPDDLQLARCRAGRRMQLEGRENKERAGGER
ncbi:nucleotidyltransferase family protein [Novosphingobium rosa]|uniref:nucleotidyltransferase family protein n=1 Tax=Novosphingobium rosa TaxID=76978 RepID=UPI000A407A0A|nr:nucleotidyltransferase family protein [Novosphingobium rosa]